MLPMEKYGSQQGPMIALTNLKVGKVFKLAEKRSVGFNYQLFNLFNTSASTSVEYTTGSNYGRVLGMLTRESHVLKCELNSDVATDG
jgi:hypothetical protein